MGDVLTVYKALNDGVSPYQRYRWPLPNGDQPGDYVTASGKPKLCSMGVHGYLKRASAEVSGNQVFEMEIEGDIVKDHEKAAGRRGRLIRQLSGTKTVTIADVVAASSGSAPNLLDNAATTLGVPRSALAKALKATNAIVVAPDDALVSLDAYLEGATPADAPSFAARVAAVSKVSMKVEFRVN